ncbi:MAG: SBBP repeat-containing protein [Bacteroidales bacterium]|nr:SBBP repeat-containing protein [Bacteroidales bacterium]
MMTKTNIKFLLLALFGLSSIVNAQNFQWAIKMGGTGFDMASGIAVDNSGNIYTTGQFQETVDFDPGSGTYDLISAGEYDIFISKFNSSGELLWAKQIGGVNWDVGHGIAVSSNGNIYVTGHIEGTADFDPGPGVFNLTPSGSSDAFIVKLDNNGNLIWVKQIGGTDSDFGYSISVDLNENVYTTGIFKGTVDFDPGTGTYNLSSAGSNDIFVSKLDAFGNFVWAKSMGGSDIDYSNSITIDISGNVYITGRYKGTSDFDPDNQNTLNLSAVGEYDIFVMKLNSSGDLLWAKQMGGPNTESGNSIAVDSYGNVYTTGYFKGTVDFDTGPGVFNLTSAGYEDIYISKLDISGNLVWVKQFGSSYYDVGNSISVDNSGNVYNTGYFDLTVDFDPGTSNFNLTSVGSTDMFISKLEASGDFISAKQIGGQNNEIANSIFVDNNGNIYTTGCFEGSVDFDPGPENFYLSAYSGNCDIFVIKLNQNTSNIKNILESYSIRVYPNPTNELLCISFGKELSKVRLIVRNTLGIQFYDNEYINTSNITLNIDYPSDIYILEIVTDNNKNVLKLIKE